MGSIDPSQYLPTVRLAIFECGTPLPLAKERYGSYGGMFEALFAAQQNPKALATEKKITFSKYQVDCEGAEYPDSSEVDVILMGTPCEPFSFLVSSVKSEPAKFKHVDTNLFITEPFSIHSKTGERSTQFINFNKYGIHGRLSSTIRSD